MSITLHTEAETKLRDAAPDLAEALLAFVNHDAFYDDAWEMKEMARSALAKAGL